ncbi:MAG: hypothetical protein IV100_26580 [Myxococcales bacterium]|nr:hypothetical protein [Myxococcales bacterium]
MTDKQRAAIAIAAVVGLTGLATAGFLYAISSRTLRVPITRVEPTIRTAAAADSINGGSATAAGANRDAAIPQKGDTGDWIIPVAHGVELCIPAAPARHPFVYAVLGSAATLRSARLDGSANATVRLGDHGSELRTSAARICAWISPAEVAALGAGELSLFASNTAVSSAIIEQVLDGGEPTELSHEAAVVGTSLIRLRVPSESQVASPKTPPVTR